MAVMAPKNSAWIDQAPVQVTIGRTIDAPASKIWQEFAECSGWSIWAPGVKSCYYENDENGDIAPGVGAVRYFHQDQYKVRERIIEWEPTNTWGITVIDDQSPVVLINGFAEVVTFTENQDGTEIEFRLGADLKWWVRPFVPLLVAQIKSRLNGFMDGLEKQLSGL